ncbi:MAG: hypothetical protein B6I17_04550 [Tenericutes bacterium 4572_104]|nr:MAG: hypothetical protein B6I17_04550 [Tenericutes bacterium 4572_104]
MQIYDEALGEFKINYNDVTLPAVTSADDLFYKLDVDFFFDKTAIITETSAGYLDSMSLDKADLSLVTQDDKIYVDARAINGGDIKFYLEGKEYSLDCTTGDGADGRARVEIPQGTSTLDKFSIVYAAFSQQEDKIKLFNSEVFPVGAFLPIAYISIQDYNSVVANGPIVFQRTTEAITFGGQGAISRMRENTRLVKGGGYRSGIDASLVITQVIGGLDNIAISFTSGSVYQINRQSFPAMDIAADGVFLSGISNNGTLKNFDKIYNLNQINETSEGEALVDGDCITWDIYGNINYSHNDCKLFVIPFSKKFTNEADAAMFARGGRNLKIPHNHRTVGFHICRLAMKYSIANGGTWTNLLIDTVDIWTVDVANIISPNYPNDYPNGADETHTISKAGALEMKVIFETFDTEADYDFVRLYDINDNLINTYHGNLGDNWKSDSVPGDTVKVRFTSDSSVIRKGFKIAAYEYKTQIASGSEIIDIR